MKTLSHSGLHVFKSIHIAFAALTRLVFVPLLILSFLASTSRAQSASKSAAPDNLGSVITGSVTIRGKGPARALVTIWRQPSTEPPSGAFSARTDPDGKYRIVGIDPGNYYIGAHTPGFVASRSPRTLAINNETLEGVDFELVRGAVVSGRIADNNGKPLAEQLVTLIQTDAKSDPSAISATPGFVLSSRTDDRGVYRLYGLPAGHYKLVTGLPFAAMSSFNGRPAYARTFYSDVVDESKAKVIELTEGMQLSDVNISVGSAAKLFSISGLIVDGGTDQPIPNIEYAVNIFSNGRRGGIGSAGVSNSRGEFQVDNLPPGRYTLSLPARLTPDGTPPPAFFGESKPFDIVDLDVSDIEIRVAKTATVSGFIQLEDSSDKTMVAKLLRTRLTVTSMPPKPGNRVTFGTSSIQSDGSFAFGGLEPGKLIFSFSAPAGESVPFQFKHFGPDGSDQTQNIEVKAGDEITGIHLIAVYATGSVHGVVKLENGPLPPNTRLVARLSSLDNALIAAAYVDGRGHFLLENVPAGNHKLSISCWMCGVHIQPVQQEITVTKDSVAYAMVTLDLNANPVP